MSQLSKRNALSLRREWRLFDQDRGTPEAYLKLCNRMIEVGEFLLAHDVARAALERHKNHKELSQRGAHALCKAGSPKLATQLLEELVASGGRDVETQSLLASAYKDLCEYSTSEESKFRYADLAIARYEEAYNAQVQKSSGKVEDLEKQYYPCINVAFMHFMFHHFDDANVYAKKAREICLELRQKGKDSYWIEATEAEASLILGQVEAATESYEAAFKREDAQPSSIASTRKQALQIAAMFDDKSIRKKMEKAFPLLGIVACSGHVIDNPGRSKRFPPEAESEAKEKIEEALEKLGARCGYSSAACGTDILFLEAMAERGGETHVFLPFAKEEFIETSVRRAGGNWVSRFERVLDHATSVHYVTNEGYYGDDSLFTFCNQVMLGFAAMRGRGLDEDPNLLVIWDGEPGATGGTGELVEAWREEFNEPEIIDSKDILAHLKEPEPVRVHSGETRPNFRPSFGESSHSVRSIKTMLFADVQAFSRVVEDKTGSFVESFHGGISNLMGKLSQPPVFVNTWGDSFFAVFDSTEDALKLALDIRDYFNKGSWKELLVEGEMEVRISMHAGPVYEEFDPILKKRNFFGRHVNQAARIEPIVLPGSVFVSETVAALISFGYEKYDFEYAGNLELAKDFGSYPIYMLQRKGYSEEGEEEE